MLVYLYDVAATACVRVYLSDASRRRRSRMCAFSKPDLALTFCLRARPRTAACGFNSLCRELSIRLLHVDRERVRVAPVLRPDPADLGQISGPPSRAKMTWNDHPEAQALAQRRGAKPRDARARRRAAREEASSTTPTAKTAARRPWRCNDYLLATSRNDSRNLPIG